MAKILFITDNFIIEPLGIMALSAALKKDSHKVDIIKTDRENIWQKMRQFRPDFLCYSVTTGQHKKIIKLNKEIKKQYKTAFSVFGGSHSTYFPEMIQEEGIDAICRGEGDLALVELVNKVSKKDNFMKTQNFWFKNTKNEVRPLIQNLDSLPLPDRELIYKYPENLNNPIKNVMTARGCNFECPYCYNSAMKKIYDEPLLRFRGVDLVIEECLLLKNKYQTKFIFFQDDMFITQKVRLEKILTDFKREIDLPYHCQIRAELLTENTAKLLKETGCKSVTFAIESGVALIREHLLERKMTKENILNCANLLHKYAIKFRTENMVGLPYETLDDAIKTLDINRLCKPTLGWASVFQPYPGTKLGDLCKILKLSEGNVNDFETDFFTTSPLKIKDRKKFDCLQKLFGVACNFILIRKGIKILISLPLTKFYSWLSRKHKHYIFNQKLYVWRSGSRLL